MIRHYFTLFRAADEIKHLIGCQIASCFSQEKDSVILEFDAHTGPSFVSISVHPKFSSLFMRNKFARAKKNTVNVFNEIVGDFLQNVEIFENNRIVKLTFINFTLYAFIFGGSQSKIVIVDSNSSISSALNCQNCKQGDHFSIDKHEVRSIYDFPPKSNLLEALSKSNLMLGKYYSQEFMFRNSIDDKSILADSNIDDLLLRVEKFKEEIFNSGTFFLYEMETGHLLSLIELNFLELIPERTFNSIGDALAVRIGLTHSGDGFKPLYKKTLKIVSRSLSKVQKKIEDIDRIDMIRQNADKYQEYGELLLSQSDSNIKDRNEITLFNWNGDEITIKLDPKLNLVENAQIFFKKAKNSKSDIVHRLEKLPQQKEEEIKLENLLSELENIDDLKNLDNFIKKLKLETGIRIKEEQLEAQDKFRTFDIGEGYTLYVGKNAANNDELTVKFAKPNDIWMHARGSAGSHAVLRGPDKEQPPKYIIKAAASIAAYYSQARKAKLVPVAYTQKKYVRKPKGANTGSVTISREEVIMVKPGLPEQD